MKIKLIEDPQPCSACDARMTDLALHDRQCSSCGMPCYPLTGEQMRLRQSWEAVLMESGLMEQGGSRW